jgi:hypothetical protein
MKAIHFFVVWHQKVAAEMESWWRCTVASIQGLASSFFVALPAIRRGWWTTPSAPCLVPNQRAGPAASDDENGRPLVFVVARRRPLVALSDETRGPKVISIVPQSNHELHAKHHGISVSDTNADDGGGDDNGTITQSFQLLSGSSSYSGLRAMLPPITPSSSIRRPSNFDIR